MLTDPVFYVAVAVFVGVMLYFWHVEKEAEKAKLYARIRKLEEKQR